MSDDLSSEAEPVVAAQARGAARRAATPRPTMRPSRAARKRARLPAKPRTPSRLRRPHIRLPRKQPPLPPVEELNAESDYTVFLTDKVPEAIRRAALRKLWTSDPVLANLDGLNNYDEDYNVIDTPISALQTATRPARAMSTRPTRS